MDTAKQHFFANQNACKLCAPLGACLAIRGIEGAVPFLHGSQGCATYIRRYLISHFREPMDVASSNFNETAAVFGGERNLKEGLLNVSQKYRPSLIGVATTCLAETMGEDVRLYLKTARGVAPGVPTFNVSTPSYSGTHAEGFWRTVYALTEAFAEPGKQGEHINLIAGMLSTADFRYLKEIISDFGIPGTLLPDYSDTLDGPTWVAYQRIPKGGTPLAQVRAMGRAKATVEFCNTIPAAERPGRYLQGVFGVVSKCLPLPIGVRATDRLFEELVDLSHHATPVAHAGERLRLLDAYVDGHKYVSGKRAVVYGEQELVVGLAAFLAEIGIHPVVVASGAKTGRMTACLESVIDDPAFRPEVVAEDVDFFQIEKLVAELHPDVLIGNSKGYTLAQRQGVPLVRVGFPIHDRIGGGRILHVGYRGAQQLFDRIVNTLLAERQREGDYTYL
jgi:nitrogenase molybdenum-iron protein NifN